MKSAKEHLERQEALASHRSNYETDWEDIARYMRPNGKGFNASNTEGERKNTNIYDSMPIMVMENFEAGLYTSMTPDGSKWLKLQHVDEDLNKYGPVKDWFSITTERVLKSFGPGFSGFYNQIPAVYGDCGAFGTGILYTAEETFGTRFIDKAISLKECWIDINEQGEVDTLYRKFELTARQCVLLFGDNATSMMKKSAEKNSAEKFWIIHGTYPLEEGDYGPGGQRFGECYTDDQGKSKLKEGYYYEFPYMVPRWKVAPGERYGRGVGHTVLADVKSLNVARKSNLNMMTRAGQPSLLAHSEVDIGGGTAPYPGEMVFGAINSEGKRLIQPLEEGKNPAIALEMEQQLQDAIKDGTYFGLMKIDGSANMTATEFMGRNDERQRLLGPYLGRIQSELLSPLVKRRAAMLRRMGMLPQPPRDLVESGGGVEIRYVSPLAKLQTRAEGEAAMTAVQAMTAAAQLSPDVTTRIDSDKLAEQIVGGFGADFLNTQQEADEIRAQQAEAQRNQAMAENASGVGSGVKQLAEAQQIANAG